MENENYLINKKWLDYYIETLRKKMKAIYTKLGEYDNKSVDYNKLLIEYNKTRGKITSAGTIRQMRQKNGK